MKEHPYIRLGQTLGRVPFLSQLDDKDIDRVLLESVILQCDPGDVLIEEGAEDCDFFILLKGGIRVLKKGVEVAVFREPGEIVGEQALATGEARTATVEAVERSFVLKVACEFTERLNEEQRAQCASELGRYAEEVLAEREG